MNEQVESDKLIPSGSILEGEVDVEEGEIQGEYNAPTQSSSRLISESCRPQRPGKMPSRRRVDRREIQDLMEDLSSLTKRLTFQEDSKSIEVICKDIKTCLKKLDKIRRLMKRDEYDFRERSDVADYVQKVFVGLRGLYITMKSSTNKKTPSYVVVHDLMKTAMNYRRVLFGKSQKRELEDWVREFARDGSYTIEKQLNLEDSIVGYPQSMDASRTKPSSTNEQYLVENPAEFSVEEKPLTSSPDGKCECKKAEGLNSERRMIIHAREGAKMSLHNTDAVSTLGNERFAEQLKQEENRSTVQDSSKRKEDLLMEIQKDPKRQKPEETEKHTSDEKQETEEKKPSFSGEDLHRIHGLSNPECIFQEQEIVLDSSLVSVESPGKSQHQQDNSVDDGDKHTCNGCGKETSLDEDGMEEKAESRRMSDQDHIQFMDESPRIDSVYRKPTEGLGKIEEASMNCKLSERLTPPLLDVFKPRPISPDIILESPPDNYWKDLIYKYPHPRLHEVEDKEIQDLISDGKLILVVDLDSVLFSTSKSSSLDSDSTDLLHACIENESHLSLFARTLYHFESQQMWVKLRPGLRKFLKIAKHAFLLYGHTTKTRQEVELILSCIDPEGFYFDQRILYQESSPDELLLKKVKSLGESMKKLNPITFILDDGCFSREDNSAVLGIESYLFFPESKARVGLTSKSLFETRSDEDECGFLMNALDILLQIRQQSFWLMSHPDQPLSERPPSKISQLSPWDIRRVLAETRSEIFQNVVIVFDRILSSEDPKENQILWRMATSLGAKCSTVFSDETTHLVSINNTSALATKAKHSRCKVVLPTWIEASYYLWYHLNEDHYQLIL